MEQVVVPALVAAVVTLGIEYFAKPWLDEHRRSRELLMAYNKFNFHFGQLATLRQLPTEMRTQDYEDSVADGLFEAAEELLEHLARSDEVSTRSTVMRTLAMGTQASVRAWKTGAVDATDPEIVAEAEELILLCDIAIKLRPWDWRVRRGLERDVDRLMRQGRAYLAKDGEQGQ